MKDEILDVVISFDLDGTLLSSRNQLSPSLIQLYLIAQGAGIPCFITTARQLNDLILKTLKSLQPKGAKTISVSEIKKDLEFSSFTNVIQKLKEAGIDNPKICTFFDPCITNQKLNSYYHNYELLGEYLLTWIIKLDNGDINVNQLIHLLERMRRIVRPEIEEKKDGLNVVDNPLEIDDNIFNLLQKEQGLFAEFKKHMNGMNVKLHQFLFIKILTGCSNIIHTDDYSLVYKYLAREELDSIYLHPACKINFPDFAPWIVKDEKNSPKPVWVHCIPFSEKNSPAIKKVMIEGMNLPVTSIIRRLDSIASPCGILSDLFSCCFNPIERQTIHNIISNLTKALLLNLPNPNEEKKAVPETTEMTQPLLDPFSERHEQEIFVSRALKNIIIDNLSPRLKRLLELKGISFIELTDPANTPVLPRY